MESLEIVSTTTKDENDDWVTEHDPFSDVWRLSLEPRNFTDEEKYIIPDDPTIPKEEWEWRPWEDRIQLYCPDGDAMVLEFVLPLDSDGNPAPDQGVEYVYTIQPNILDITSPEYITATSKMGKPYPNIFDIRQKDKYPWAWSDDRTEYCNARRGFTWKEDGFRGVWYKHYLEDHLYNMDEQAPAIKGTITVKRTSDVLYNSMSYTVERMWSDLLEKEIVTTYVSPVVAYQYELSWELYDDSEASYKITGDWTGPVEIISRQRTEVPNVE